MKILLLADPFSAHTIKWANGLHSKGLEIMVFGLSEFDYSQYHPDIKVEIFKIPQFIKWQSDGNLLKSMYLLSLPSLKKVIRKFKPDILNAHSASSYGLLGVISGFHPLVISVWGNDVYNFPRKHKIFRKSLEYNLGKADSVLSTSKIMAKETAKYTSHKIHITPFGIDTEKFKPKKVKNIFNENDLIIGTVKSLEPKYGSELLFSAFREIKSRYPQISLKLLMVGRGSLEHKLQEMIAQYDLKDSVIITGFISFDKIPDYHNMLDIYIAPSTEESETFGVAILEASACAKPVIVSDVGGLPEVVIHNKTGIIVKHNDQKLLNDAVDFLVKSKETRTELGKNGRKFVQDNYNWQDNLNDIINIYKNLLNSNNGSKF